MRCLSLVLLREIWCKIAEIFDLAVNMHSLEHLNTLLIEAKQKIEVGALYSHYRTPHQSYRVLSLALDEATEAPCVVYQALYGDQLIWVRTVEAWCEYVSDNGQVIARFIKMS